MYDAAASARNVVLKHKLSVENTPPPMSTAMNRREIPAHHIVEPEISLKHYLNSPTTSLRFHMSMYWGIRPPAIPTALAMAKNRRNPPCPCLCAKRTAKMKPTSRPAYTATNAARRAAQAILENRFFP